jgi:hypothetical protein
MTWLPAKTGWLTCTAATAAAAVSLIVCGGCGQRVQPKPGAAAVVLEVGAKPKAGAGERFTRVPVYDAAPRAVAATGQFERVDYNSLGDIVVWLEPAPEGTAARGPQVVSFDPTQPSDVVHAAAVGQEVLLRNGGGAPASLYSVSDENDFDLPGIRPGGSAAYTVRAPGLIEVLADPSLPPVALIYAAPSPWVARARAGETVVFDDVPPGTYEALSWHPRLPGKSATVSLAPNQVTRATLDVGVKNIAPDEPQR